MKIIKLPDDKRLSKAETKKRVFRTSRRWSLMGRKFRNHEAEKTYDYLSRDT